MTVELATEVNFKDSIQNKKCNAKNTPEMNKRNQSALFSFRCVRLRHMPNGTNIKTVNKSRYIAIIEAGAVDHLIKIAENETEITPIINNMYGDKKTDFFKWVFSFHLHDNCIKSNIKTP
ncbi:hypothetical protein St703_11100 [Sporolactobacillus terrae]|uniref:Uncharacterized protein n=1 Tax=Sporolactobacillus terrae TaxID=269673 RepID=A0A5K7WV49_9BACL|nr:hypothetical protein St703_11100 [Sporolactobacillus terrae]